MINPLRWQLLFFFKTPPVPMVRSAIGQNFRLPSSCFEETCRSSGSGSSGSVAHGRSNKEHCAVRFSASAPSPPPPGMKWRRRGDGPRHKQLQLDRPVRTLMAINGRRVTHAAVGSCSARSATVLDWYLHLSGRASSRARSYSGSRINVADLFWRTTPQGAERLRSALCSADAPCSVLTALAPALLL